MAPPQVRVGVGAFVLHSRPSDPSNPTFLLGKRLGSHGANTYALPGGHLEFGETPEECHAREVLEETGLVVRNVRFMTATNDYMEAEGKHYVTMFTVSERADEAQEARVCEPEKCEAWEWVTWRELVEWVRLDATGEGAGSERRLFLPLLNLVRERSGVVPRLD